MEVTHFKVERSYEEKAVLCLSFIKDPLMLTAATLSTGRKSICPACWTNTDVHLASQSRFRGRNAGKMLVPCSQPTL